MHPSTAQQPTDIDTYEDDDDDDDDVTPYDVYSKPDDEVVESDTVKDEIESENKKLLKDALDDLSDEEPPEQKISSEDVDTPEKEEDKSDSSEFSEEEDDDEEAEKPKLTKMWPPPPEPETDKLPLETRAKPSGTNVLRKWPPAMGVTEEKKPVVKTVLPPKVMKRQWPPPQPEPEQPTLIEKIKPLESKPVVVPERKVVVEKPPSPQQQKIAVSLRPVKKEGPLPADKEETTNLFPLRNLKKATKKMVSTSRP